MSMVSSGANKFLGKESTVFQSPRKQIIRNAKPVKMIKTLYYVHIHKKYHSKQRDMSSLYLDDVVKLIK